ncbi:hypothetical protein B0H63DRAFT_467717 [Podospora didyma]|uniref:Uncharacterized protein n=1 Tax=Podospora didyma TaxID=330526 RepID=A0AAE0U550_9PEZI|nr:hypothetical protein B0H63DRAFT_467717 [Podospora didyma]
MMPCSNCYRLGRECIVAANSRRCKECIDQKVSYNGSDFAAALARNMEEEKKLEEREEELTDKLISVQGEIISVRRRRKVLRTRGKELFGRGMVDFEKENPPTSAPPAQSSFAAQAAPSPSDPSLDWSTLDPSLLEGLSLQSPTLSR